MAAMSDRDFKVGDHVYLMVGSEHGTITDLSDNDQGRSFRIAYTNKTVGWVKLDQLRSKNDHTVRDMLRHAGEIAP